MMDELKAKAAEAKTAAPAAPATAAKAEGNGAVKEAANGAAKKTEVPDASPPSMSPPMVLAGALAIAFVVACVQQSEVMEGGVGSFTKWSSSLFEEHIVPPPIAHDSVCTVQFCQS